jgi:hypothetical protein
MATQLNIEMFQSCQNRRNNARKQQLKFAWNMQLQTTLTKQILRGINQHCQRKMQFVATQARLHSDIIEQQSAKRTP